MHFIITMLLTNPPEVSHSPPKSLQKRTLLFLLLSPPKKEKRELKGIILKNICRVKKEKLKIGSAKDKTSPLPVNQIK